MSISAAKMLATVPSCRVAIGILTGSGTYALPGFSGTGPSAGPTPRGGAPGSPRAGGGGGRAPAFTPRAGIRGPGAGGATAVSQTAGPETVLCGEAELPYALLGYLTDYANGVTDEATPVSTLVSMMAASTEAFASVLRAALPL